MLSELRAITLSGTSKTPSTTMNPTPANPSRLLQIIGTLWLLLMVTGQEMASSLGLMFNQHGHQHNHAHGHPFADARAYLGIPNAMDVLSNLPIFLVGLWVWHSLPSGRALPDTTKRATQVFSAGLMLTGIGSAIYHWAPSAYTLVWDRSGMAIAFAGMLSLALAEHVSQTFAQRALSGLVAAALFSAWLPVMNGNALPWGLMQLGGVVLLAQLARQPLAADAIGIRLNRVIGLYLLAKALELSDAIVFHASAELISGHSLKHFAAALAAWPVMIAIRAKN